MDVKFDNLLFTIGSIAKHSPKKFIMSLIDWNKSKHVIKHLVYNYINLYRREREYSGYAKLIHERKKVGKNN